MVRLLLEKKADPNSERILANGDHYSALFDAVGIWPDKQIAEILIQYGANVNYKASTKDVIKLPILNFAICKKNTRMVQLLLENNADPDSERILAGGMHFSALYDAESVWPNNEIAGILRSFGAKAWHKKIRKDEKRPQKGHWVEVTLKSEGGQDQSRYVWSGRAPWEL